MNVGLILFIFIYRMIDMDVKGANIMVTHSGHWVLIDYETLVKTDTLIIDYTECFYPEFLERKRDIAKEGYDWYMLLVFILIEVVRPSWKERLFSDATLRHRVDRQKVHQVISTNIAYPCLRLLCEKLELSQDPGMYNK